MQEHRLSSPRNTRRVVEFAGVLVFSCCLIVAVTGKADPMEWRPDAFVMLAGAIVIWAVDAIFFDGAG